MIPMRSWYPLRGDSRPDRCWLQIRQLLPLTVMQRVLCGEGKLLGVCPLAGLVRSVASTQKTSGDLRIIFSIRTHQGIRKGIVCLP